MSPSLDLAIIEICRAVRSSQPVGSAAAHLVAGLLLRETAFERAPRLIRQAALEARPDLLESQYERLLAIESDALSLCAMHLGPQLGAQLSLRLSRWIVPLLVAAEAEQFLRH